ncbi:MAG: NADPH-dependent FMN reductase [Gaiellaceae bacterium]
MRVLAISGSLRRESMNTALLRAAAELAPPGVEVHVYARLGLLPPYNADEDQGSPPEEVAALRAAISAADAVLIATPEYNASVPGQLKTAVDWASRPFRESALWGKNVAVVGASSGGSGTIFAQQDLRRILGRAGARVLPTELAVPLASERLDDSGHVTDEMLRGRLQQVLVDLAEAVAADTAASAAA